MFIAAIEISKGLLECNMNSWLFMLTRSFSVLLVSPAVNGMPQLVFLVFACPETPTAKNQRDP